MTNTDDTVVSVKDLRVMFSSELGSKTVLHDISLDIGRSRTTAIVGESGSGKTVTAYSLMRLIEPPGEIVSGSIE